MIGTEECGEQKRDPAGTGHSHGKASTRPTVLGLQPSFGVFILKPHLAVLTPDSALSAHSWACSGHATGCWG